MTMQSLFWSLNINFPSDANALSILAQPLMQELNNSIPHREEPYMAVFQSHRAICMFLQQLHDGISAKFWTLC
jgi:hypothetical protein